jgi:hypothetical protein
MTTIQDAWNGAWLYCIKNVVILFCWLEKGFKQNLKGNAECFQVFKNNLATMIKKRMGKIKLYSIKTERSLQDY